MTTPLRHQGIALPCPRENRPLLPWILLLQFLLLSAFAAAQPTLSTDLPDYPPGATVTLTGAGFAPGDSVLLQVVHVDPEPMGTDPDYHQPWTVLADASGGFVTTWVVPLDGDEVWATLLATADGSPSGLHAEVSFTDAPPPDCSVSAITGASSRCQGSGQNSYSVTYNSSLAGVTWTVTGTGNSISFANGSATVTWGAAFSGTATITFTVTTQCTGQSKSTLGVVVSPVTVSSTAGAGSGATATAITANWSASANATKYLLDVSTDAGFSSFVTAGGKLYNSFDVGNVTNYTVTGLTASTTYYYRVRASNGCGSASVSNVVTYATLATAPAAPVAANGSDARCTQVTASWSAVADASGYYLDVARNNTFSTGSIVGSYKDSAVGAGTSFVVTGLVAGTSYFYRVRAANSGGFSPYSNIVSIATLPATPATPGPITGLTTVCSGATGVSYSVSLVSGSTSYLWTLPSDAVIASGDGTNAITVNFGSTSGTISVKASNTCGTSNARNSVITVNIPASVAGQPQPQSITYGANASFTATASGTPAPTYRWQEYSSSWSDLSDAGSYSGTSTATLGVAAPGVAASGRKYRCIVSNSCGSDTTDETALLTVAARPITITADAVSKTYGYDDPALTAQVTAGSIVGTDAPSGALDRAPGANAGTYAIGQGTYSYGSNYAETFVSALLTIDPRPITITADPQTKTYGDPDPLLRAQVTAGSIVGTETATGTLSRAAGSNVGRYAITQGTYSYGSNYAETFVRDSLTITPRHITLTADALGKTYGDSDPVLSAQVTTGNTIGTDAAGGALSRAAGEDVGTYAIGQGTYTYGSNYEETYAAALFTIGQRALTINVTAGQHKVYGYADPSGFAYTLGIGQHIASWDAFSGALTRLPGDTVGNYNILQAGLSIRNGSDDNTANYNITYNGSTFAIDRRPVTIKAFAKSKTYGDPDPALTYCITLGSLVPGDAFSGSLVRDAGENAGKYAIRQGTVALTTNYTLTYVRDSLTILPVTIENYVGVQAPGYRQYSDTVTIRALIEEGAARFAGTAGAASSVTFKIGTQVLGTVALVADGHDLVASLNAVALVETVAGQMAPGMKVVTAVLNDPNPNYGLSATNNLVTDNTFRIDKEDARIDYSGDQIMGTASATAVTATVKLRASILDITAVTGDAAYDPAAGDIRKAKVKFVNRDNGADISGWLTVNLVAADSKIGTVAYDYAVTLGSTETDREISIGIIVDNGYYYRNNTGDNTVLTVYKPVGDFITGGGHVIPDKSVGTYKSDAGTKTNFGFNVKYNKKGASLQGNMNIIFRRKETDGLLHTYQIKANSLQSLGVNASNPGRQTAQFSSKANLTDVTNPLAPVAKGGNKMLYVYMTDRGDPGTQDSISFVLVEGSADPGVLANVLYSSEWLSNKNGQKGLRGGNLVVKSGFSVGSTSTLLSGRTSTSDLATTSQESLARGEAPAAHFELRAYPNHTQYQFNLLLQSDDARTAVALRIYDLNGRLIQQFPALTAGTTVQVGGAYANGTYIAEMVQGSRRVTAKLIKE